MAGKSKLQDVLAACLGDDVRAHIDGLLQNGLICVQDINEIRLRVGRPVSLTCRGRNITLALTLSEAQMSECVAKLCRGSVYAHSDTIRMGYIRFPGGVRVGVCGTLAADGRAVGEITSLNIRIPHIIRGVSDRLYSLCQNEGQIRSTLIYSAPGVGKTTALRELAARFGQNRRVAVVDTRGELFIEEMFGDTLCDFLVGYPRAQGIEIATRTMAPELLICDELGDADEARQILSSVGTGVPIVASAHALCVPELMARPNIRLLHEGRVFSLYVGIQREIINGRLCRSFLCESTPWEAVL